VRPNLRLVTVCAGLVCAFAVAGLDARAEFAVETYKNPKVVAAGRDLVLFLRVAGTEVETCLALRRAAEGDWNRVAQLRADYNCVTYAGDRFYLFLPGAVIELSADNCGKTGGINWYFNWEAQSAVVVGRTLIAFGVGPNDSKLYRASISLDAFHATRREDSPQPAEAWRIDSIPVEGKGEAEEVRAVLVGDVVWLFWTSRREGDTNDSLYAGAFKDGRLEQVAKLDTVAGVIEFAAAAVAGEPFVVFASMPRMLTSDDSLRYRIRHGKRWLPVELSAASINPLGEHAYGLTAATLDDIVHVFVETELRVLGTTFDGSLWSPVESVQSVPWVNWVIEHSTLWLGLMVIGLVVLLASLVRARYLPRRAVIGGVEYALAPWWQRGGAYAFDLLITFLAVQAMLVFAGQGQVPGSVPVGVFCFELFYFTACEARSGRTLGKKLFGLIVVSRNGGYPNWAEALTRNFPRALVDSFFLSPIGWLVASVVMLNTRGSPRIGDLTAGTYVVREHANPPA